MSRRDRAIQPLTPALAEELVRFWTDNGFDASLAGEGLAGATDVEEEEAWIRQALDCWGDCGRVIFCEERLIAYAKYADPELFGARAAGIAARVRSDAALLAGLCVAPELSGRGLAKLLLSAVERDLFKRGFAALETFAGPTRQEGPTALRPLEFYEGQGFRLRSSQPDPPIVRLELKTVVSWTENLDAVLDALLSAGAAALPRRAPAPSGT